MTADLSRRTAREVLDDHLNIANEWVGADLEEVLRADLERNVSEDVVILIKPWHVPRLRRGQGTRPDAGRGTAGAQRLRVTRTWPPTGGWVCWSGRTRTRPCGCATASTPT